MPAIDQAGHPVTTRRKARKRPKPSQAPTVRPDAQDVESVVKTRRAVRKIHTTPVPSPDARDATRPAEQKQHDADVTKAVVKAARVDVLRARHRGSGVRAIKAELEGHGLTAKALAALASLETKAPKGKGSTSPLLLATTGPVGLALPQKIKGLLNRGGQDLINAPAQVIPSVYVPAAGAVEAAKGHPERIKKFAHDIDKGDPVYNAGAAVVDAVRGDTKSAGKRLDQAKQAASDHPGFTALEVVAAKGALGRGTTRVARRAGGKAAKAVSTERAPRTVPGTSLRQERHYSPDAITKAAQVAVETTRRRVGRRMNAHADRVEPTAPGMAEGFRGAAAKVSPDKSITEVEIQRRVDEHVDSAEHVRRAHRGDVVNETRKLVKPAEKAGPVANLTAQGIVKADVADLRDYVAELEKEYPGLSNAAKRSNKTLRKGIEKTISHVEKGDVDLGALSDLVAKYREGQAVREKALADREMLPDEQAMKAAAIPYAVRRMGAMHDKDIGLTDPHGAPLHLADIHAHMLAHGEPIPSFLSQAPNARGARNFFQSSSRAPHIDQARRTGEATKGGTFDAHPDTLVEQAARQQGLVDAFDGFHGFLDEFALKGTGGHIKTLKTRKQVEQAARDAMFDEHGKPRPGAIKFVPVRVNPFGGRHEQLAKMLEGTDSASQHGAQAINDAVHSALSGVGDGDWALVPEAAAKRLQEHVRVLNPGNLGKVGQKVNTVFRKTVLATSIPWLTGNVVEGGMRAALAHAGPRSYVTGRRVLKRAIELDKQGGEQFAARTVGGGHFGSAERQHVHLNVDSMNPGKVKALSKGLGAFWRSPGPKQAASLWHNYTHTVFNVVNRAAETQIQTAMLGKALRDSHLMSPSLLRLSEKAVDEAARGALDVNTAADLGRQVDLMYGKYGKWSPDMRKLVALYTPFVAWTLNATYFVLRTLPRDHPVATGLIAATEIATDEWRKEHGLDKFIKGAVPDWLEGSIPLPGGGHLRAPFRYTPFGAWSNLGETLGGNVLPLYTSPLLALKGLDWTGKPLRGDDGQPLHEPFTELAAGKAFVEATVPALSVGERVAKGGPGAILDSALGKVAPAKRKASRGSGGKPGFVGGSGSSGGFVKPGGSGGGFVR